MKNDIFHCAKTAYTVSLSRCALFLFFVLNFSLFTFHSHAQGLTKYGESTSSGSSFINGNGKVVGSPALNKNGHKVGLAIGYAYQGGIVAYILQSGDPGYNAGVTHGLIAATSDQSTGIEWWNGSYTTTGATATAIGTGNANTNTIVTNQGAGSYAAQLCADLVLGGYGDWYLPSKDELNLLYSQKDMIGGFTGYWSSSECDSGYAWFQFDNGVQISNYKGYPSPVRAIRAF